MCFAVELSLLAADSVTHRRQSLGERRLASSRPLPLGSRPLPLVVERSRRAVEVALPDVPGALRAHGDERLQLSLLVLRQTTSAAVVAVNQQRRLREQPAYIH